MPVFNASDWLDECLQAILEQDFLERMELSVYDDGSTVHTHTHTHMLVFVVYGDSP